MEVGAIDIGVEGVGLVCGNGESVMRNPIEIDYLHSRVIIQEIGERLRTLLKEDRELPASLRLQIDQLDGQSQPNVERPATRWWPGRRQRTRSWGDCDGEPS
jgi:hypothetical protein